MVKRCVKYCTVQSFRCTYSVFRILRIIVLCICPGPVPEALTEFPKSVQLSFLEACVAKHIEDSSWEKIALQRTDSLMESVFRDDKQDRAKFILKIAEKIIVSILDQFDPDRLPADGSSGTVDQLKDKLSNALTVVMSTLDDNEDEQIQDLKDRCQHVVAICSGVPMAGRDTLEDVLQALLSDPAAAVYRVFNSSAAGKVLQEHAEALNQDMQAAKDALVSLAEAEESFKGQIAVWAPYMQGQEEEENAVPAKIETLQGLCKKLTAALKAGGADDSAKIKAVTRLNEFLETLQNACYKNVLSFLENPASQM